MPQSPNQQSPNPDFDDKVRRALEAESARIDRMVAETSPGLLDMALSVFRGRFLFVNIVGHVVVLAFMVLLILSAVWFFSAETTRDHVLFATIFLFSSLTVMMMKVWFWMVMNRNAVTREIKRLELRIAAMGERGGGGERGA